MNEVKNIEVIFCSKERRGEGKLPYDPIRIVEEIFTKDGKKIMESDPFKNFTQQDMIDFGEQCASTCDGSVEYLFNKFANNK